MDAVLGSFQQLHEPSFDKRETRKMATVDRAEVKQVRVALVDVFCIWGFGFRFCLFGLVFLLAYRLPGWTPIIEVFMNAKMRPNTPSTNLGTAHMRTDKPEE